jgi:hypothetical protein
MAMDIAFRGRACQAIALAALLLVPAGAAAQAPASTESAEDGWLDEALAEYLAYRYLEERQPAAARRMLERAIAEALAVEPLRPLARGARLYKEDGVEVARATLRSRGMMVLRTLEAAIGRRRVDSAIAALYERHGGRSTSTEDLRAICEEIAARDLGWFFRYYVEGTELPTVELRRLPALSPNEFAAEIVLGNVPEDFTLRVEMTLATAQGAVEHSVATRGTRTPFTVTTASPVLGFALDPHLRILRRTIQ